MRKTVISIIVSLAFSMISHNSYSQSTPETPENLIVMSINFCSIGLSWLPPLNYSEVTGYNIYRDGVLVGSTEELVYNDNSILNPETSYTYRVTAFNANGNESNLSASVSATTLTEPAFINPDSEVIPEHSLADWSYAGVIGGIPNYSVGVNVIDYGAVGDGNADDTNAINAAIAACPDNSAVFFPEGIYRVTNTINVSKPIVLRGEGPDATIIQHAHSGFGISILAGVDYAGIEDIHIQTTHAFNQYGGRKVSLEDIENCWVRNIETSGYTDRHIYLYNSSHCEIRDSYFHNSYQKCVEEGYSHSYGVEVAGFKDKATYNLVENNVLDWFSSAMILQVEAHYNVYAYNFHWNAWGGDGEYSVRADFEFHHYDYDGTPPSHFIYHTLVESNVFEQLGYANSMHRKNTIFRNRVNNGGITIGHDNVAFGNELVEKKNPGTFNPGAAEDNSIRSIRRNSIAHGNYITVSSQGPTGLLWDQNIADQNIPNSFYLTSRPDFFGDLTWPCFGGDLMPDNSRRSPAEVRYWSIMFPEQRPSNLQGNMLGNNVVLTWDNNSSNTVDFIICRSSDNINYHRIGETSQTTFTDAINVAGRYYYYVRARNHLGGRNHDGELHGIDLGGESDPSNILMVEDGILSTKQNPIAKNAISVFPNPAHDVLHFNFPDDQAQTISIYSSLGKLMSEVKYTDNSVNISGLEIGMYFLVIKGIQKSYHAKFIVK